MKTILIETVVNGWIVRPFQPCSDWTQKELQSIAVYNDIKDLQADIPRLLDQVTKEQL